MPEILEAEAARRAIEEHALGRGIAAVHAPDGWFLKRGTTAEALAHALVGNELVAARRRGKLIVCDLADGTRLGLHLGMSGRVLVDDVEAGDPLVYASNRRVEAWHRFGLHFADGGELMLRDPRRLGAVELDPDEDRLGPDAFGLSLAQLDAALGSRAAPVKAVCMDQSRIAGLGNLLADEALWRAGVDPARPARELDRDARRRLHRAVRATLVVLGRRGGSHTGDLPRVAGAPCPRDGAPLVRRRVAGRTTYSCPAHQR